MNKSRSGYMIMEYSIEVISGDEWFEATTKYLPDVIEYGDTAKEAYLLICDTILVTEEYLGKKLTN